MISSRNNEFHKWKIFLYLQGFSKSAFSFDGQKIGNNKGEDSFIFL